jgi:hypothetical protein
MKINDTSHIQPKQPGLKSRSDTADPKVDFNAILKESVGKAGEASTASKAAAVDHPFANIPIQPMTLPITDQTVPLVDRIDRFLDLLDDYRQNLEDSRASLRAIQPLLDDIVAAKDSLALEIDGLKDGSVLKEVLNDSLVTAATEIMRFNRGDYVE